MTAERYNNLGWFARHPKLYELGLILLATLRRRAAKTVGTQGGMRVLDVACGSGGLSIELAKLHHDVTGIDLDRDMLEQAKKKNQAGINITYIHGDASKLPFDDHSFHAVTIAFGMHDIPHDIGITFLKEARRVLNPEGEITIIDYNEPGKNLVAAFIHPVVKLYESPNYPLFVKRGLENYLNEAGLVASGRFTIFGGVQVVKCR